MDDKKKLALGAGAVLLLLLLSGSKTPPPPPPGKANLYGVVTDADTGQPVSGVLVLMGGTEVLTGDSGFYSFTDIDPGEYAVQFSKIGYETIII